MPAYKPVRRLPLRDLMTDAEDARGLAEHLNTTVMALATPPARPEQAGAPQEPLSHRAVMLLNAIAKLETTTAETEKLVEALSQEVDQVREHAKRERLAAVADGPLPEAERGSKKTMSRQALALISSRPSGSPSPLRGGGWGEGSSYRPEL